MTYLLFENAWLLGILLFLLLYVALVIWLRRRTAGARRGLLLLILLSAALMMVQDLVVTDREAVRGVLTRLVEACRSRDLDGVAACLHPRFAVRDLDRATFLERVNLELDRVQLEDARLSRLTVEPVKGGLRADFTVSARGAWGDFYSGGGPTYWRATLRQNLDQWQVWFVDPRSGPGFPFERIEQLLGR